MTRPDVEALFTRRDRALSQHDLAGFVEVYAEDAVVESPTAGGSVSGRPAIGDITRAWFVGFPDVVFTREALVIDGDRVVWIGEVHGTDTGGFMSLPPTGKPFRLPMVIVHTLRNGVIAHERRIYDFTGMLMQIGVLKARPA